MFYLNRIISKFIQCYLYILSPLSCGGILCPINAGQEGSLALKTLLSKTQDKKQFPTERKIQENSSRAFIASSSSLHITEL